MSNLSSTPFALLAGVILLPLIPAYLLFKLLPSTAVVGGPFQGFKINLGGAFAAYFALVLVVLYTKNSVWDPPPPMFQVWTVTGTITDNNGALIAPFAPGDISLLPPSLSESPGWFTIDIPVKPGQGGTADYPTLSISHQGFETVRVDLDPGHTPPSAVTFDTTNHSVRISELRLQPLPTYQPTTPLNGQAASHTGDGNSQPAGGR